MRLDTPGSLGGTYFSKVDRDRLPRMSAMRASSAVRSPILKFGLGLTPGMNALGLIDLTRAQSLSNWQCVPYLM